MNNGLGTPQGVLLVGGTSDIGTAILGRLVGRGTARVGVMSRDTARARSALGHIAAAHPETDWHHVRTDVSEPVATVAALRGLIADMGDIDVAVLATGELTDDLIRPHSPADVERLVNVNMSSMIAILDALAEAMALQGNGRIVVLSTVAMERVRPANALYGAAKAGLDAYAQALDHRLSGTGVRIALVRPGFVHSKMTAGLPGAPMATTPEKVAQATVRGLRRNRRIIWAPGPLRWIFVVLRHLPTGLWRRLPL